MPPPFQAFEEGSASQPHSSVYVFHGPPMGGRSIPVIPTQLVSDLANHQGSGTQIATAMVTNASRTLADWLTYDALALPTLEVAVALVTRDLEV